MSANLLVLKALPSHSSGLIHFRFLSVETFKNPAAFTSILYSKNSTFIKLGNVYCKCGK